MADMTREMGRGGRTAPMAGGPPMLGMEGGDTQGRGGEVGPPSLGGLDALVAGGGRGMDMFSGGEPGPVGTGGGGGWTRPDDRTLMARGLDPATWTGKSDPSFAPAAGTGTMADRMGTGAGPGRGTAMAAPPPLMAAPGGEEGGQGQGAPSPYGFSGHARGRRRSMQGGGGMAGTESLAGLHSLINGFGQGGY